MVLIGKSVKLNEEQIQDLHEIGKRKDRKFSFLVRKAIDAYIETNNDLLSKKPSIR
ncbi:MAG: hypothetical protein ABFC34_16665 [Methanobacterium sp.]